MKQIRIIDRTEELRKIDAYIASGRVIRLPCRFLGEDAAPEVKKKRFGAMKAKKVGWKEIQKTFLNRKRSTKP